MFPTGDLQLFTPQKWHAALKRHAKSPTEIRRNVQPWGSLYACCVRRLHNKREKKLPRGRVLNAISESGSVIFMRHWNSQVLRTFFFIISLIIQTWGWNFIEGEKYYRSEIYLWMAARSVSSDARVVPINNSDCKTVAVNPHELNNRA